MRPVAETAVSFRVNESLDPADVPADHFAPGFGAFVEDGAEDTALPNATGLSGDADELLFFDLETTGLGLQAKIFMSGCLHWEGDRLRLQQEVAVHLSDERELLAELRERIECRPRLVTYNGRSFDVPLLRRRLAFHSLDPLPECLEVEDLLHRTRRLHGRGLPNCKLATVEQQIIGKQREGRDIPGAEAPLRFEDYRETGRREFLEPVLYHNRIDLTTLAALRWVLEREEKRLAREAAEDLGPLFQ